MLTIGLLGVIFGVVAMRWADGRFPFSAADSSIPVTG